MLTEVAAKALLAALRRAAPARGAGGERGRGGRGRRSGSAAPVALKVQSPDILHKTEAGAVLLGLGGEAAVREGYRAVLARAKAAHPERRGSTACWCRRWRGAGRR